MIWAVFATFTNYIFGMLLAIIYIMENKFLAVNKDYFGLGLKSLDLLIIAQVDELQRNKCPCYVTNDQFSTMFGESVATIMRSLEKLERLPILNRTTNYVEGNGRSTRQRILTLNKFDSWNKAA